MRRSLADACEPSGSPWQARGQGFESPKLHSLLHPYVGQLAAHISRFRDVPPVRLLAGFESDQPNCAEGLIVASDPVDKLDAIRRREDSGLRESLEAIGRQRTRHDRLITEHDRRGSARTEAVEAGFERQERPIRSSGVGHRAKPAGGIATSVVPVRRC